MSHRFLGSDRKDEPVYPDDLPRSAAMDSREPRTAALARREHDAAWAFADSATPQNIDRPDPFDHDSDPDNCLGCGRLIALMDEAASEQVAALRTALDGLTTFDYPGGCWCNDDPKDGMWSGTPPEDVIHTLQCQQARMALAATDPAPSPAREPLDVKEMARAIHATNIARCREENCNNEFGGFSGADHDLANLLIREYARRVSQ